MKFEPGDYLKEITALVVAVGTLAAGAYKFIARKKPEAKEEASTVLVDDAKPRILVVDDDVQIRTSIRLILNDTYSVREFEYPHDAMIKVLQWHEEGKRLDAALLDYRIAKMNGAQMAKIIGVLYPKAKLVIFSGAAILLSKDELGNCEAWQKPVFHMEEKIRQLLAK